MKKLLILVIFLVFENDLIRGDLFTSFEQMRTLVETQQEVSKYLEKFLELQSNKMIHAHKILNEFKLVSKQVSEQQADTFIGNPVNAYLLIKQLIKDLQTFVDISNNFEDLKQMVNEIKEKYVLPTNEDYSGVIKAMHRLEDTYLLNPNEIRLGNLSQKHSSRPLTAYECFELGRIAYEEKDYYHAIRWMNESLKQLEQEPEPSVKLIDVLDYLAFSTSQQGNLKDAYDLTKRILEIDPKHERSKSNMIYFERALKEAKNKLRGDLGGEKGSELVNNPFEFKNPRPPHVLGYERDVYEALCRGDQKPLPPKRLSKLKCRYISYDPLLVIAPVKEELVYDDPPIWLYHDVITESQVQIMKDLARPKLKRAIVRSPITGKYETAEYRISKSGWLTDNEHPTLPYLTSLLTAITNLSMSTAEEWQIANYGIGGQYEPHFDFARKTDPGDAFGKEIGNRIATWLFYLEAPEVGGSTVFPPIGVQVKPIRRSAAFWYNLLPSGDGDYRTRHAACPVLFGTKWVSNKWIHAVGQEFRRPCNLLREDSEESNL